MKGKVTMLFIAHQLPKGLSVNGIVRLGAEVVAETRGKDADHQA